MSSSAGGSRTSSSQTSADVIARPNAETEASESTHDVPEHPAESGSAKKTVTVADCARATEDLVDLLINSSWLDTASSESEGQTTTPPHAQDASNTSISELLKALDTAALSVATRSVDTAPWALAGLPANTHPSHANGAGQVTHNTATAHDTTQASATAEAAGDEIEHNFPGTLDDCARVFFGPEWMSMVIDEQITRYVKITGVPNDTTTETFTAALDNDYHQKPQAINVSELRARGVAYLWFSDLIDASVAFAHLSLGYPEWNLAFIDYDVYTEELQSNEFVPYIDPVVVVTAICKGTDAKDFPLEELFTSLYEWLESIGQTYNLKALHAHFPSIALQVTYFNSDTAKEVRSMVKSSTPQLIIFLGSRAVTDYAPSHNDCEPQSGQSIATPEPGNIESWRRDVRTAGAVNDLASRSPAVGVKDVPSLAHPSLALPQSRPTRLAYLQHRKLLPKPKQTTTKQDALAPQPQPMAQSQNATQSLSMNQPQEAFDDYMMQRLGLLPAIPQQQSSLHAMQPQDWLSQRAWHAPEHVRQRPWAQRLEQMHKQHLQRQRDMHSQAYAAQQPSWQRSYFPEQRNAFQQEQFNQHQQMFFEERAEAFRRQQQLTNQHLANPEELASQMEQQSQVIAAEKEKVEQYLADMGESHAAPKTGQTTPTHLVAHGPGAVQKTIGSKAAVTSVNEPFRFTPNALAFVPSRPINVPRFERPFQVRKKSSSQHVVIADIEGGRDHRTTIMLRNIPNKVTHHMLKSILNHTSFGRYDFLYLRIDFNNNCNVGYAFINFQRPADIIPFLVARGGRHWQYFNSEKIAEVCYANIQGKDSMVHKFRNSSIMVEEPSHRPKLYRVGPGPHAGEEMPFPPPDDPLKFQRSLENALFLGMYAPETGPLAGQMYKTYRQLVRGMRGKRGKREKRGRVENELLAQAPEVLDDEAQEGRSLEAEVQEAEIQKTGTPEFEAERPGFHMPSATEPESENASAP